MTLEESILADYLAGMRQSKMARKYVMRETRMMEILQALPGFQRRKRVARSPLYWPEERIQKVLDLYASGKSIGHVAKLVETGDRQIRQILKNAGVAIRCQSEAQSGEHNPCWNGGRTRVGGYWYIYQPTHPRATSHGYVAEHRLVMEEILGRFLEPEEVVHHKDKNRENNDPSNLQVFASNAEHLAFELTGQVPKWTEEGRARILEAVRKFHERRRNEDHSKTDELSSPSLFDQI